MSQEENEKIIQKLKEDLDSSNNALREMSKQFVQKIAENTAIKNAAEKAIKSAAGMVNDLDKLLLEFSQKVESSFTEAAKENKWDTSKVFDVLMECLPTTIMTKQRMEEIKKTHSTTGK